ncbi:MAG: bifunctional ADP-dependent NAD(P)H-hydrate dehydratase/NAD(P)H-hydrate epimerase, partial [Deltaproteobacteria bacterium]|nr:bifunctional ADP-dependent NAD(P)H-hydrate dehydratase/NAD(P)H-hydrate epimerase [Deltaproteobacteria bacterium]
LMNLQYVKKKIAIDVPTGICGDTGEVSLPVQWDYTLCVEAIKQGCCIGLGSKLSGKKMVVACGIQFPEFNFVYESFELKNIKVCRDPISYKYFYGPVGVLGGSDSMFGAPKFVAEGILTSGASFGHIFSTSQFCRHDAFLHHLVPEYRADAFKNRDFVRFKSIVFGPGVDRMCDDMIEFLRSLEKPVVLDAGGLSDKLDFLGKNFLITPHLGEFLRMSACSDSNLTQRLKSVQQQLGCSVLLKCNSFIFVGAGFEENFLVEVNNSKLSFGGVGDFLAGLIAGFVAQGLSFRDSSLTAVKLLAHSASDSNWSLESLMSNCKSNVKKLFSNF